MPMKNRGLQAVTAAVLFLPSLFMLAVVALPARAQDGPPGRYKDLVFDRVSRSDDLVYGRAIDKPSGREVELRLDLYEPVGDEASERPVFVFLFGGGFVAGNRKVEPQAYCELMARRGYVAVAIDYRINQGNIATDGIPAAVADTRQALAWLHENAAEHRLDPTRIILGGSSAGAITSLFTAYTDVERAPGDGASNVAAVLDLWGGLYTQVNEMETGEPPLAIVHGTRDTVVAFSEATKLRERAEAVGIAYDWHPLEGAGHAPYQPADTLARVVPFFFEQLWTVRPPATAAPATSTPAPPATETTAPPATATSAPTQAPTDVPPTDVPATAAAPTEVPSVYALHLPYVLRRYAADDGS
jgi:acetyl esterase/lipase